MKRFTALAIGLALAGAFATSAQAQYYDHDRYDHDRYDHGYNRDNYDRNSDTAIDRRVTHALYRELGRNLAEDINVNVRNGDVILSGQVDRGYQRRQAREIASNIPGVRAVYARDLIVREHYR